MNPENPEDQKLRDLLSKVDVPAGLHERLREIALTPAADDLAENVRTEPAHRPISRITSLVAAVVAATLLIAAILTYQLTLPIDPPGQLADGIGAGPGQVEVNSQALAASQALIAAEIEVLEYQLGQQHIRRLEAELDAMSSDRSAELAQREVDALILALAPQITIPLGGDPVDLQAQLSLVVRNYPGTRGSRMATQILTNKN